MPWDLEPSFDVGGMLLKMVKYVRAADAPSPGDGAGKDARDP